MNNLFALLVGINGYPIKPLQGCINDVKAVQEYLEAFYGKNPAVKLHIKRLVDTDKEQPTRKNLIKAFDFFNEAGNGDTCLFYYSGHGSYSPSPAEFWTDTNGFVQSFVCLDSRSPGGRDLIDKEMGFLIWKTVVDKPDLTFVAITDCCHSGTITKNIDDSGITDRMCPGDSRILGTEDYIGYDYVKDGLRAYEISADTQGNKRITVRQGKHIHIGASRDNQTSKELIIDGVRRGAFTHSLLKTLYTSGGGISYNNLVNRTSILVNNLVPNQNPDVNLNGGLASTEKNKAFLFEQAGAEKQRYLVYRDPAFDWCIKAGSVHGVFTGDKVIIEGVCETRIAESPSPDFSTLISKPQLGTGKEIYSAIVERQPKQPIKISFDKNLSSEQQKLIAEASTSTSLISILKEGSGQFIIRNENDKIFITKPGEEQALFNPLPVHTAEDAAYFVEQLESIVRWIKLQEFNNPSTKLTHDYYTVKLFRDTLPGNLNASTFEEIKEMGTITDLTYKQQGTESKLPAFRLSITNHMTEKSLWLTTAYLGFDYGITTNYFKEMEVGPGKEAWLYFVSKGLAKDVIPMKVDERYEKLGYSEITEYLKLFIGLQKVEVDDLHQDGVDLAAKKAIQKGFAAKGPETGETEEGLSANEWTTETVGFRIIKPQAGKKIGMGKPIDLNNSIVASHPSLEATVSLTSSESANRNPKSVHAPNVANFNSYLEPYDMGSGNRSGNMMDVLELVDVKNPESVTPDEPLVIEMPATRSQDEGIILPIGYDAETKLYYPLGHMTEDGKIIIEILPGDTPSENEMVQKGLLSSLKIYFQKVIGQKIGLAYNYPRLARVTVGNDLNVDYDDSSINIKNEVAKANTIILFIHGIIGDTESMVKCIKTSLDPLGNSLEKMSNLVLAFDYENLNTPIEENAKLLKERLEAVGLNEGHGKNLIIIAHSMGGLLSRWFIEKLGGNKIASKLVMLGTPNNGTPWADVRDLSEALLTYAINGAAFLKPWMFVLSSVGRLVKGTQVTLKQMDTKTGIYDQLNMGADPGVPYIIVAGNTRLIDPGFDNTANLLQKLFKRVKKKGVYDALDVVLFKKPNDIAVSTESIETLKSSDSWLKKPKVSTVASDHLNYFLTLEALKNIN